MEKFFEKILVLGAASLGLIAITASVTIAITSHSSKHSSSMHYKHGMAHDEVNMPMLNGRDTSQLEVDEMRQLFQNHRDLNRTVELLDNGIKTITETDNEDLITFLVGHAAGMINRVEENRDPLVPIQSPTLEILFKKGHLIETDTDLTDKGLIVIKTSSDTEVVKALQKHALEVSDLAERGMAAVHEQMMNRN